ncbi:aldolase catalytic domain-containing protein [Butyricicoccus sp.]|uniref:aldolase catalytic domain-containing protein n=1 Tax=Butyricicoccus sp. TaxID=2049021 RepID=UPI003F17E448
MAKRGNLMTFREDVRVVDATIRDGGLCNNFYFTDEFVRDLYKANQEAGVDYMEFGYKASADLFNPEEFGKWKFCHDEDIYDVVGDNDTDLKIAVMADVGRTNYKRDIIERSNSPIDLVRVATYINTMPAAIEMIEHCAKMGYETTCNIMAVSKAHREDLQEALEMIGKSSANAVYLVDSYGSLYPEEIRALSEMYLEKMDKYGKQVGIHAHNNQMLAFANTIEACATGVSMLDATMNGMGRGAGNCMMEQLMGFLKNPKYQLCPVLHFIEQHMLNLREEGVIWGYNTAYLLTGRLNMHPRSAIAFSNEHRHDFERFYLDLDQE